MFGPHCLTTWSTTQSTVSLSSAEAEYNAMVLGASAAAAMAPSVFPRAVRRHGFFERFEVASAAGVELLCEADADVGCTCGGPLS